MAWRARGDGGRRGDVRKGVATGGRACASGTSEGGVEEGDAHGVGGGAHGRGEKRKGNASEERSLSGRWGQASKRKCKRVGG